MEREEPVVLDRLAPVRMRVEELGPGRAREDERRIVVGHRQWPDQLEERRFRPVDVVDHHDEGRPPPSI